MGVKDYFSKLFPENDEEDEDAVFEEEETITPEKPVKEEKVMEKNEIRRGDTAKTETYAGTRAGRTSEAGSAVLELKVVRPEKFSSVGQIADHLLNRCTVVLNLEAADKDTARRIVDFLNGVSYSIDGEIKPVANNTFIITPHNVAITGEQLSESASPAKSANAFDEF